MAYTYDPIFAQDPNNPNVVASNAAITIYDPADAAKTPIAITDPTGSPLPNPITVDARGMGSAFQHPTLDRVAWTGAGLTNYFTSYEGMKNEAKAAKEAAQSAQAAASTAGAGAAAAAASALAGAVADAEAAQAAAESAAALVGAPADAAIAAAVNGNGATKAALSATILDNLGYVASPSGSSASDVTALNARLSAAAAGGGGTVTLRAGTYDLSSAHVVIPKNVTLQGSGAGTVLNGGAFAIINDGTIADLEIGTGWSLFSNFLSGHWSGNHGVAIIGGTANNVTSQRGATEIWTTRRLHNALPRTVARLRKNLAFKKTNIVIISDSLGTDGSGTGIGWAQLLFDDTYKTAEGSAYNVGNIFGGNNTKLTKLTVPGSTPEIDLAYIGYEQAALSVGDSLDGQVKLAENYKTYPPTALANADLAIICQGHNGGTSNTIENIVANLRARGTEVIIVMQNPSGNNDPNFARHLWAYRQIAATYGCAVADTYSVFLREIYAGRSTAAALVSNDSVHPNQAGWNLYAQTIRDVLLDQRDGAPATAALPTGRVITNNTNDVSTDAWGNVTGVQFAPVAQSAGVTFTTPSDSVRSPLTGRRLNLTNTLALVPVGEYVEFSPSDAYDVNVIFEQGSTAATAAIRTNAGANTIKTYSVGTSTGILASTNVDSGTWGAASLTTKPIRIYSTAGTLRIIGVTWTTVGRRYQPRNADGSFKGVTLSGTWAVQAGPWYGVSNIPVTDTAASYAEWEFIGDGFWLKTVKGPSGGVLRVTIDGVTESGVVDTYSATETIHTLIRQGLGYGRHKVRIAYEFANGSAVAGGGATRGARRLALYEIASLDARMNANQADLTRPAEVI